MSDEQKQAEPKQAEPKKRFLMGGRGITLGSMNDLYDCATMILHAGVASKHLVSKGEQITRDRIAAAIAFGLELGMGPMQAAKSVICIRNQLTLPGDAARALCEASPTVEWIKDNAEELAGTAAWTDDVAGVVSVKRTNRPEPVTRRFTVKHAKKARLWGQAGPWTEYPERMLYYRPLGFVLRDACGDILKGLTIAEELRDYPDGPQSGDTIEAKSLDEIADGLEHEHIAPQSVVAPDPEALEAEVTDSLTEEMEQADGQDK